jgi:hypothetical protein
MLALQRLVKRLHLDVKRVEGKPTLFKTYSFIVLPLHQRLKLMNKGERLDFWGVDDATERDDDVGLSSAVQ